MDREREQTRFIISRFDAYISGANTKGNFLLAFNTFLSGGIITNYSKLKELVGTDLGLICLNILLILLVFFSLITTILIIKAVYPFLVSGNSSKRKYHSHIFFNSVAEFDDAKSFYKSYSKQTDQNVEEDLANQAYHLSKGLKSKYHHLEWSMRLVYGEIIILLLLVLNIILF